MNELRQAQRLRGKNVVVIGGSRGLGRAIVAAAHAEGAHVLAVARQEASLGKLTEELSGVQVLALDATSESAPARVFAALSPDVLIVCAGAIPHMAPLGEQSWEQFSRNWNTDVKIALLFSQAALTTPLPSGTTIILMSSGAAISGSPLSGGMLAQSALRCFLPGMPRKNLTTDHSVCASSRWHRAAILCQKRTSGRLRPPPTLLLKAFPSRTSSGAGNLLR